MQLNMDDGDDITVDMGPLIDCVFLLLIFFLVSTILKKPEPEIPIELPAPAISAIDTSSTQVQNLTIDKDGNFYWSGVPIKQHDLHKQVREFGQMTPVNRLRIKVDRNAPSRFLVQVLDLCAYEGLTNYGLHTQDNKVPSAKQLRKD